MTGFGLAESRLGNGRLLLEVRSLNHRFLEVRVRLPVELTEQTFYLEQRCRQLLHRGRFDVSVRLEGCDNTHSSLDLGRARRVHEALLKLRDELLPDGTLSLDMIAAAPGVLQAGVVYPSAEARAALDDALEAALESLQHMKRGEGEALRAELLQRLENARALRERIAERGPQLLTDSRQRLTERIQKALQSNPLVLDPGRLELEVALLADKTDVTEELARLECHFAQFERLCQSREPVGRRLEFLLQEVGREANTIGSKCPDATLSHLIVELKAELERLREQVQNVE